MSSLVDSDNPKAAKKGEPGTGDGDKMFLKGVQKTKISDILKKYNKIKHGILMKKLKRSTGET